MLRSVMVASACVVWEQIRLMGREGNERHWTISCPVEGFEATDYKPTLQNTYPEAKKRIKIIIFILTENKNTNYL